MKKRILVTGASGFIGFHTALRLNAEGYDVTGIDNFNNYYTPRLKEKRAQKLHERGIEVIKCDINDHSFLSSLFQKKQFTHVIHLAAQAGVRYALENSSAYVSANISGFCTLLEILRTYPAKLIFASSSSVYGLNEKIPFSENDRVDHPASFYAATKKSGEILAYSFHHNFGIPMIGLRFFTVYGPWGRPDMAYFSFTDSILSSRPIRLFNYGNMERDFTYIDDIVPAIVRTLDFECRFEIFNLGNNRCEKLLSLVDILERLLKKKAIIELEGPQKGEVPITYADISKAQKSLGYAPKWRLEQGLEKFLEWYLSYQLGTERKSVDFQLNLRQ